MRLNRLLTAQIAYVDDLGGSIGKELNRERMSAILARIRSFGWVLAPEKIVDHLLHRLRLLGFMLDTSTMTIGMPEDRKKMLIGTANVILARPHGTSPRARCTS